MGKEISVKEKVRLIEECLSGRMRYREAARRAGVHVSTMQRWISHYRTGGEAALQGTERQKYGEAMKQKEKAVKDYIDGGGSLLSISEKYQIITLSLLMEWVQVYHRHNKCESRVAQSSESLRLHNLELWGFWALFAALGERRVDRKVCVS